MAKQRPQITTLIIPEENKKPFSIKSILVKYLYHWPLFVLILLLALSAAVVYIHFAKPSYQITATLIINENKKSPDQQSALSQIDLLSSSKQIENEMEIIKSNRLISQVIKELQLATVFRKKEGLIFSNLYKSSPVRLIQFNPVLPNQRKNANSDKKQVVYIVIKDKKSFFLKAPDNQLKECNFNTLLSNTWGTWRLEPTNLLSEYKGATIQITFLDSEKLALDYQKAIDVSLTNKLSTSVSLTLDDEIAQRGKDILNTLISDYKDYGKQENELNAKATLAFLDNRLDSLTSELNIVELDIEGFKSSRGLTDISTEAKINLENLQDNDRLLNNVKVKLSVINEIENYVNSPLTTRPPATLEINDPALNSLIESLSRLLLQKSSLLAVSPETNPDFEPLNRQIATTRAAIRENIASIKSSLLSTQEKLQSFNTALESSIKKIPTEERQLVSIKRQQAVKEGLYTYLLQKREEIAANYATLVSTVRIVDQAYISKAMASKKEIALALALILGFSLPIGIIYLRNNLNESVINASDIENVLEIPIIGEVAFQKNKSLISFETTGTSTIREQLRTLRTNLYYLYGDKTNGRVTLVTSSLPEEGKTFISSNLGITLAQVSRKTIILEMNLRQPKLEETFKLKDREPGITDFLNDKAKLEDIIHQTELNPNLYFIASGAIVNNPAELLEKPQLKYLIDALKNNFDDIIINSAPVHLFPDATILSRLTDITLYIIKQGFTETKELEFLREINNKKHLNNIQIVFNGVQRTKYGYGYNYGNSYSKLKEGRNIFSDFWKRF
ncbi:polysaccharide biosynthesis tyrosine autokinase [Pedobacter sp. SD-b]|uniref:Polysaccharide biosynthesis tyrosine autokinase n=1 Tax=Pedobacter segetis TaxID=2793069 RepID=A0ABS1BFQ4_9SPHI|nr:polysaccharide biosynthesis tyrosine autokinase [Pedobacter segetis]MBK0381655.1 polysaccharide biosynthesis tyrosine autokinase [Pedobacter segetis]